MPVITLECGKITKEQKAKLVKEFVRTASETIGVPEPAFVTIIKENEMDNIGSGTSLLSDKLSKKPE